MGRKQERHTGQRGGQKLSGHVLMGRNSLREVLRHDPGRLRRVLLSPASAEDPEISSLLSKLPSLTLERRTPDELTRLVGSDSHQGCVAELSPTDPLDLADLLEALKDAPASLLVALDNVNDPQNLGSIIRAAECLGADAVIWSKNRGSSVTPAVTKASVGASELLPLVTVSNLAQSLARIREAGYWLVAADVGEGSRELSGFEFPERSVLILGSEGAGVSRLLLELADFRVHLRMRGRIDSLNVSQAAAVFMASFANLHLQ